MSAIKEFKGKQGLQRLINATGYSKDGLAAAWKHEAAFREEVMLAAIMVPLGLWLGRSSIEQALLVGTVLLVLIVELLNSAAPLTVANFLNYLSRYSDSIIHRSERTAGNLPPVDHPALRALRCPAEARC